LDIEILHPIQGIHPVLYGGTGSINYLSRLEILIIEDEMLLQV
jgi:hypothetical protein